MNRRVRGDTKGSLIAPVGWLFADLLLAVAMLFLVANTINGPKPKIAVKPTPTPVVTVTPTPANSLLLDPVRVDLFIAGVNLDDLNNQKQSAIVGLENKIKAAIMGAKGGLQNRQAGLVIAYGGASTTDQESRGYDASKIVYNVLRMLGTQNFVFCHALYYKPLFSLLIGSDAIELDIYFYSQSKGSCLSPG